MPPDEPSGTRPTGPVVLRIKLRYDTIDTMVQRFAPNVGKSGLFLPTRSVQPVGAEIKFELRLVTEQPVLIGLGRVKVVKAPDPDDPKATFGMAVELMRVTRESRELILKILERRRQLGLVEVAIPMPADIDAARRIDLVESAVRDVMSGAVSAPIAVADSKADGLMTSPRQTTGPIAMTKVMAVPALAPEPTRRKRPLISELIEHASGPVVSSVTIAELDSDVDVAAVMARARVLAGGDLDAELDVLREAQAAPLEITIEAASAELARHLGGVAVRRGWSTPPAISEPVAKLVEPGPELTTLPEAAGEAAPVDAAPADAAPVDAAPVDAAPVEMSAPEPADTFAEPDATAFERFAAGDRATPPDAREDEDVRERARDAAFLKRIEDDDAEDAAREWEHEEPNVRSPVSVHDLSTQPRARVVGREIDHDIEHEVEPDQIRDEIHQLEEGDFEEIEQTQIGAVDPHAFDEHSFVTRPANEDLALAERLDAHLAEVEAEAEHDDLGIGEASGLYRRQQLERRAFDESAEPAAPILAPEYQQDFVHRFAAPSGYEQAPDEAYADQPVIDPYGETRVPSSFDSGLRSVVTAPPSLAEDEGMEEMEEIEEIDDFEIIAEADAEDEDLLAAHGEADASGDRALAAEPQRPSASDFALRLDLGDESDLLQARRASYYPPAEAAPRVIDDRIARSAGHALAAFDDEDPAFEDRPRGRQASRAPSYDDQSNSSFTLAADPDPQDPFEFDAPAPPGFPPLHQFDQSDVIDISADLVRRREQQVRAPSPPVRSYHDPYEARTPLPGLTPEAEDLESALEALDVDLDDLAVHGETPQPGRPRAQLGRSSRAQRQDESHLTGSTRPARGVSDDGILIDFDDDDDE